MLRPVVIVTESLPDGPLSWLAERAEVVIGAPGEPVYESAIERADALIVRTYTIVDGGLLDRAPRLRVVGRAGVGLDNIDQGACHARSIAILNTPDANTSAVAEYVFSLIFHRFRPLQPSITEPCLLPAWEQRRDAAQAPRELNDLTLGIIGFGRIGSRVGRIAAAIGMTVLYHDLLAIAPPNGCQQVPLDRVFAQADVLSLHVDGRPANRHFISIDQLDQLKSGGTIINTSRGLVVDESALAGWLKIHTDATALLDVHEHEPISADHPLLHLQNARLYPHVAAATRAAKERMGWVVRDVWHHITDSA